MPVGDAGAMAMEPHNLSGPHGILKSLQLTLINQPQGKPAFQLQLLQLPPKNRTN
jgi:hypothetical protein